ncbi:actin binding [Balamuthia mandrillaris]
MKLQKRRMAPLGAAHSTHEKWVLVQKKTFTAWVNWVLSKRNLSIEDLSTDLSDGVILINLLELLSGQVLGKYRENPTSRVLKIENVGLALTFLLNTLNIKLYGISAEDIVDGNTKIILGMIWRLIQTFRLTEDSPTSDPLDSSSASSSSSSQSTINASGSLSSSSSSSSFELNNQNRGPSLHSRFKGRLLAWCQECVQGHDVSVDNFDTSWTSGVAFCAIIHKHHPELIDFASVKTMDAFDTLSLAFELAEKHFDVPKLLDPEDMLEGKPEELSIITYVSEYYRYFRHVPKTTEVKQQTEALSTQSEQPEQTAQKSLKTDHKEDLSFDQARKELDQKLKRLQKDRQNSQQTLQKQNRELKNKIQRQRLKITHMQKEIDELKQRESGLLKENSQLKLKLKNALPLSQSNTAEVSSSNHPHHSKTKEESLASNEGRRRSTTRTRGHSRAASTSEQPSGSGGGRRRGESSSGSRKSQKDEESRGSSGEEKRKTPRLSLLSPNSSSEKLDVHAEREPVTDSLTVSDPGASSSSAPSPSSPSSSGSAAAPTGDKADRNSNNTKQMTKQTIPAININSSNSSDSLLSSSSSKHHGTSKQSSSSNISPRRRTPHTSRERSTSRDTEMLKKDDATDGNSSTKSLPSPLSASALTTKQELKSPSSSSPSSSSTASSSPPPTQQRVEVAKRPLEMFEFLKERILAAQIVLDQLEMADDCVIWDHESDNQWREDDSRPTSTHYLEDDENYLTRKLWDVQAIVLVQAQVRMWLAKRHREKLEVLRRHEGKHEQQIITIQAALRRWQTYKRYQSQKYMHGNRTRIVKELLSSERYYVEALRKCVEVYLNPLRKASTIISPAHLKTVFSELEVILNYNALLLTQLEKKVESWNHEQCIGDTFLQMTDFLKVYTQYVNNFPKALTTLNACKQKNNLKAFLLEAQKSSSESEGQDLGSLLNYPVQRIPKYVELITELLTYTSEDHPDHTHLKKAVTKVQGVAEYVEEKRKVAENIQSVLRIGDMITGKSPEIKVLAQPSRRYLREGPLLTIKGGKEKHYYYFLFNDMLIATKKNKSSKKADKSLYKFVNLIHLSEETVVKICPDTLYSVPNSFQVIAPGKHFVLACEAAEERRVWVEDINNAINVLVMHQRTIYEKLISETPRSGGISMTLSGSSIPTTNFK